MTGRAGSLAALVVTAVVVVSGGGTAVANAGPEASYRVTVGQNGAMTSTLSGATFARTSDGLVVTDDHGHAIDRVPAALALDGVDVPLRTTVAANGRTATIAPDLTPGVTAAIKRGAHPVSARKDRAYYAMLFHVANGLNRAGTVSAAAGAGVGTVVGAAVGLVVGCSVLGACLLAIPAAAAGAAIGATVAGAIGTQYGDPKAAQSVLTWLTTR
ncbi:hypothetical protein ACQ7HM_00890 [Williamsia sp. MIQD14]|uniref:hypothetical protein n=1 Tax=Williamsia sp. MIQD14 TaxID=3425703 RepID=UPI003DA056F4